MIHNLFVQKKKFILGKGLFFFLIYKVTLNSPILDFLHQTDAVKICNLMQSEKIPNKKKV